MSPEGRIVSVNVSDEKGTCKRPMESVRIGEKGIEGDAHSGSWHRQVSLLSEESIRRFSEDMGREIGPGEFAENLTVEGVDLSGAAILDRFRIGQVELETTQIGKECHGDECAIFRETGKCVMPREGVFCRVLSGGEVKPGDKLLYERRCLPARIITLSDRASSGEYEDRSGPEIRSLLDGHFRDSHWRLETSLSLIPDDAQQLNRELAKAVDEGAGIIITSGGTGIGPRDIAPEVVADFCDKLIPGIMEAIRLKYGSDKPNALLSRSVAGIRGETLLYALPGSLKAVREYMDEILKTVEHALYMIRGIDTH